MTNEYMTLILSFLPFALFAFINGKVNTDKSIRSRQYVLPFVAVIYSVLLMVFRGRLLDIQMNLAERLTEESNPDGNLFFPIILFNTVAIVVYLIIKVIIVLIFRKRPIPRDSFVADFVEIFYTYDEFGSRWFIKEHYGQARTFVKAAYDTVCSVAAAGLFSSCILYGEGAINAPFYPVFAVIILGELAFFIDGQAEEEQKNDISMLGDRSKRIAMYPLLRKPLRDLFGDKLSSEGTTVNEGAQSGGSVEDILIGIEKEGGHIGRNYASFIRGKMKKGLKPNADYVRSGYDLSSGKSLLFNTPFYDKLDPYVFYAMNRELLTGGKVLIVLGRHGTEEDLRSWCEKGMLKVSNIDGIWKTEVLSGNRRGDEDIPDIGIISRSGVHDIDIHRSNMEFLNQVSFIVIVEPSRLVATAQIGLNLLIKCCGKDRPITFCSVDRNCDGLVDSMSHILMADITEVSATEYPHGTSSYMCWTADSDYLQHRIVPGVSRYLGIGTELSMAALKNQVKKAVWYGGDVFPVLDVHWIAKQYYYDLLDYARLPANQETFDDCFKASFNMCNEKTGDYSFVTVEDDRNNLFETRRNFATIAERQGFVNVISPEYLLREYMSSNTCLFTADAKAIPYVTADYARTKRNSILSLCLLLCVDSVLEETLERQMAINNIGTDEPVAAFWKELAMIFCGEKNMPSDRNGNPIISIDSFGKTFCFRKDDTIIFRREYSVERGRFESVYTIENRDFIRIILNDLQNAAYIAEQESRDNYIGSELKGHVYQKYMPGQLFTINGKYYEMISAAADDKIMVRRASDHINGRFFYRQIRNYTIHHIEDSSSMGALKTVNNVDVHYCFADFSVETPGYWKLGAYNDFKNGVHVKVNGVPKRDYHHKQILCLDFSRLGESFTDSIRLTLTNLLNEVFVTLFADNQPFISAVTAGIHEAPLTYGLCAEEEKAASDKCIYIIEDSQLDIGLLIAVERSIDRIFNIISDYLTWNEEQIAESMQEKEEPKKEKTPAPFDVYGRDETKERKGFLSKFSGGLRKIFKKKQKKKAEKDREKPVSEEVKTEEIPEEKKTGSPAEVIPENEIPKEETTGLVYEEVENEPKSEGEVSGNE